MGLARPVLLPLMLLLGFLVLSPGGRAEVVPAGKRWSPS